jgi:hypothetical protein
MTAPSSDGSSLSGLFTRVETGHVTMSSAGNGAAGRILKGWDWTP